MRQLVMNHTTVVVTHTMQQAARVSACTAISMMEEEQHGRPVKLRPTGPKYANRGDKGAKQYVTARFGQNV